MYKRQTGFFVANKETGEVYSSYTGKTVKVKEEISQKSISSASGIPVARASNKEIKLQVSYAELYELCDGAINYMTVAGAILAMVSVAYPGITGLVIADIALSLSSIGLSTLKAGIESRSTEHGLQIRIYKETTQKHQGGRIVTGYRYTFSNVERY